VRGEREIVRQRIKKYLSKIVRLAIAADRRPLEVSALHLEGEPVPPAEAMAGTYTPCLAGEPLGGMWATTWLRLVGTIPPEWAGSEVRAAVDLGYGGQPGFGGEALVFENGCPAGAINTRHRDHTLTVAATGNETVLLHLEVAANPEMSWRLLTWPLLGPDYDGDTLYRLGAADLVLVDAPVEAAYHDLRVLFGLAEALGPADHRSTEILDALDQVCSAVDLGDVAGSLAAARPLWSPLLDRPAAASAHQMSASGHAHIDTAWLWPVRETRRKCTRTFASVLGLMDRYEELRFACSQAQQHAFVEADQPELFERIRKRVGEGRFEPVGSMWVESDTNVPSGESLVRQIVHGKRYFLERYGIETVDLFLPDAFGYSGALPQILRRAGISYFLTQKLSWNEIDAFPHHTFWWEGIDGSRVLAHCPPADTYNGDFSVGEVRGAVERFAQHGRSRRSLYLYGFGDGGGGPTREMLESARRMADLEGLPRVTHDSVRSFFETVAAEPGAERLPVWCGELYLERHRGVFTTQAAGKAGNRRCEQLLRDAELWCSVASAARPAAPASTDDSAQGIIPSSGYPAKALDAAWKTVLINQFHDILPGSSINWVHREARADYDQVTREVGALVAGALSEIAGHVDTSRTTDPVIVFNSGTHGFRDVVEVDLAAETVGATAAPTGGATGAPTGADTGVPTVAVDVAGGSEPVQDLGDGRIIFSAAVPGCGWARYDLAVAPPPIGTGPFGATGIAAAAGAEDDSMRAEVVDGRTLRNGLVTVTVDDDGLLSAVHDEIHDRAVLAKGSRGNLFQLHVDLPNETDAWDVDRGYFDNVTDLTGGVESIEVVENGPVRAALRVVRRFGAAGESVIDQLIRVTAHSRRVEFVTTVDWHEDHRFLKVAFPVAVRAQSADFEIQFGHTQRATHENTSWDKARFEVPAQRWANLGETGYGVALLNDCKYGYDVHGNVLRLSLLRSPGWPDPEADRGRHVFRYALLAHGGDLATGLVTEEAENFNLGLRAVRPAPAPHAPALHPGANTVIDAGAGMLPARGAAVSVDQQGIFLSAAKPADDGSGDLVLRVYEAYGGRGEVEVGIGSPFRDRAVHAGITARRVDLLERDSPATRADHPDLEYAGARMTIELDPFELATVRIGPPRGEFG
jgi:alpha-mannosidase